MKALLMTLCVACTAMLSAAKIAVIDMEVILEAHPNTPNDKKLLETTLEDYSAERDALRAQLEEKQAALEKMMQSAQNPMLAPAKVAELKAKCEKAYQELDAQRMKAEDQMQARSRELSELERRLIKRTSEEVLEHVKAYAKEKGIDAVLYKNMVPYMVDELNITDEIITLCGGKKPAAPAAKKPAAKPAAKAAEKPAPAATPAPAAAPAPVAPLKAPAKFETAGEQAQ
jgi:Skp family chaperone for outer membrane proteins